MNKAEQTLLLDGLAEDGIVDCYIWRGQLMVLNEFDKEQAEKWLDSNGFQHVLVCEINSDMDSMIAYG